MPNEVVPGNVTAAYFLGNGALLTGIAARSSYSNVQVATYLPTYTGNIANIRLSVSGVLTFSDSTTQTTAAVNNNFSNVNVAAYTSGLTNYSNVNTAAYLNATGYNLYSNVNVAAYLSTATINTTGNITASTISASNIVLNGSTVSIGAITPAYMVVGLASSILGVGNGNTFILDTTVSNVNSQTSYNTSTGVFTLTAGVTYDLSFTPSFISFTNTTTGFMCYEWVDATTNVALDTTGTGVGTSISSQDTTAQQDNATARVIYTPTTNQTVKLRVTNASGTVTLRGGIGTQAVVRPLNSTFALQSNITFANIVSTGNVTAAYFLGNGSQLSGIATKITGSWTVPTGNSTQSFTVAASNTYLMWVDCNIPNGILTWNATATVTNSNVPVVGAQYAWVYSGGGTPIDFTSIPNQFVGTGNTIVRSSVAPSATTNRFDFGINNTSGGNVTVRYGYVKIS